MLDNLIQDLRYAARTLAAKPGFTCAAILTLALGIGANALVFSLIDGIYLKPLPYRDDAALVTIDNSYPKMGMEQAGSSIPDYLDRRAGLPAISDGALYSGMSFNLAGEGAPERVRGIRATPSLFTTLGVQPALGRAFGDAEAEIGRDKVVVLGNDLWRNRFNADPSVIGRNLRLNDEAYQVVGVMPRDFLFPDRETQLIVPFAFTDAQKSDRERGHEFSSMVARLAPGATLADIKTQSDLLIRRNAERLGAAGDDGVRFARFLESSGFTVTAHSLREQMAGKETRVLFLLQIAVALVLLIACANIANLLLSRLSARQKELAVRTALGAGRARIVRQLLVEALLLACAGGVVGVAIAWLGTTLVAASGLVPSWVPLGLDVRVVGFTLAISLAAGVVFGIAPALSAISTKPQQALRDSGRMGSGRGAGRARNALVVVQLALAVTLLAGAGLLVRSFANVLDESPGFSSDHVLTAAIALPEAKYPDDAAQARGFARLVEAARGLAGVTSVAVTDSLPFGPGGSFSSFRIDGRPTDGMPSHGRMQSIDEGYFESLHIPLLRGRTFRAADWNAQEKVAVIDALFERKHFPDGDALGQRINPGDSDGDLYTIVGVVGTVKTGDLAEDVAKETYYFDFGQAPSGTALLVLRTSVPPAALVEPLRAAVRSIDPGQPLFDIKTFDQRIDLSLAGRRVPMQLLGVFSALALLLAAVGIYGVLSFAVAQRSSEFGVRMAIGADASRIRGLVFGDAGRLVGIALAIGIAGALALGQILKSQLFGVASVDPASLAAVVGVLALTAFLACWLPARRAAHIAPIEALRNE